MSGPPDVVSTETARTTSAKCSVHDGVDGVMLGIRSAAYHLKFTHKRGHTAGPAPTEDNLLVFYLPDREAWQGTVDRMVAGYDCVPSFNPYWDRIRRTFEDPDGHRVVLQNASWMCRLGADGDTVSPPLGCRTRRATRSCGNKNFVLIVPPYNGSGRAGGVGLPYGRSNVLG